MGLIGNSNEEKIWNYFQSKGLNDYACSGIIGNLYVESGLNSKNLQNTGNKKLGMTDDEYVAAVDSGSYSKDQFIYDKFGFSLAQWTYWSRKKAYYEYAKSKNKSIGDLESSLEFLYKELSEDYKSVLNALKTATSVKEASNVMMLKYERPANQSVENQNKRANICQGFYDKYANIKKEQEETKVDIVDKTSNNTTNTTNTANNTKMKYNVNNKPLVCMLTNNTCYKGTSKMDVKGVLWHSTGANNPWLKRYVQPSDDASDKENLLEILGVNTYKNDWNHTTRKVGMNCFIGKLKDGTVATVQTMPWNYRPWGCSSGKNGSCNSGWIQFEIAEDSLTDKDYFDKVYNEACQITAYLCDMHNLNPYGTVSVNNIKVPVILCHADSYKLGMGNNHADVLHWFKKHNKTMDDVRNDVAALMNASKDNNTSSSTNSVTPSNSTSNSVFSSVPYKVKVFANTLNIRKGAGTNYEVCGVIKDKGTYTIIEEINGEGTTKWGRLKSGAGFISLDYCKKV